MVKLYLILGLMAFMALFYFTYETPNYKASTQFLGNSLSEK
jgi:hypothetical protein